ncbi:MAG: complex I subunit 5 family protein [Clostridium cochlearium]|uniref:complex I subunit 5 family protein n=1 Tax=Clostridium cochlearium TaxID=1494 RepID=UPI00280B6C9E|nr:complex I subunit 5 family protein [Clostridium cochlearium]MDU1443967.1 complex I subunit 5 family protein [Clostridium cochlearium]
MNYIFYIILIVPLLASIVGFVIGRYNEKIRDRFNIAITFIVFLAITYIFPQVYNESIELFIKNIMGTGLSLKIDMFRYIFIWLTSLIWFLVTVYSVQYLNSYKNRNRYYLFFMLTYWSTLGIFISENLLNLFTFFEIMSLTSYPLIIHDEDEYSHEAGDTYIIMAVTGGLVLLMGLFLLFDYTQTLEISSLKNSLDSLGGIKYAIVSLIVFGFGIKAGMFPLHIWLPKAHPAAPAPASAVLSGVLLKTGIFGIMITSQIITPNDKNISLAILILGFITMFLGGFLALFQRNIKRILAYSSMSQMGYILVAIGLMGILEEHKYMAFYGTTYHIINHMIFKVLLFMGAGVIYMYLHELSINHIGGFGKNKKLLKFLFFIGICGITAMPGFNGFISKNIIHHALIESKMLYKSLWISFADIIFVLSSGFTVAYLLKIFMALFIEEGVASNYKGKIKISKVTFFPMIILAFMTIFLGVRGDLVMKILYKSAEAFNIEAHSIGNFYSIGNIKSSMISVIIGVLIYKFFIKKVLRKGNGNNWWYENIALNWFSLEKNIYIPVLKSVIHYSSLILRVFDEGLLNLIYGINYLFRKIGEKQIDLTYKYKRHLDKENQSKQKSLNESFSKTMNMMSSITYSIYVFAIVLIILLMILIF